MGESDEDRAAREKLRTAFLQLDRVLTGLGCARPPSATVHEHLRSIAPCEHVDGEVLDAVEGSQALLYAPEAEAPQLHTAAAQIEDVARVLEQCPPTGELPAPATERGHASSHRSDTSAGAEDVLDSFDGPNPQLSRGTQGKSSSGLHGIATLLAGGTVVVAAACIALWKPGMGIRTRPEASREREAPRTDSLAYYTGVLSRQPRHLKAHRWLADHYYSRRDYARALYHYEWVIRLDSENAHSLNNLAWLLLTASRREFRDPPRALKLAQRAVRASRGDDAHIVDTLAVAYFQNGQKNKAMRTLEDAPLAERDPEVRKVFRRRREKFMRETPPGNWDEEE